jgi:hypothetical protein
MCKPPRPTKDIANTSLLPAYTTNIQRTLVTNNQKWVHNVELAVSYTGDKGKNTENYIHHLSSDVPYNPQAPMAQITNSIWLEEEGLYNDNHLTEYKRVIEKKQIRRTSTRKIQRCYQLLRAATQAWRPSKGYSQTQGCKWEALNLCLNGALDALCVAQVDNDTQHRRVILVLGDTVNSTNAHLHWEHDDLLVVAVSSKLGCAGTQQAWKRQTSHLSPTLAKPRIVVLEVSHSLFRDFNQLASAMALLAAGGVLNFQCTLPVTVLQVHVMNLLLGHFSYITFACPSGMPTGSMYIICWFYKDCFEKDYLHYGAVATAIEHLPAEQLITKFNELYGTIPHKFLVLVKKWNNVVMQRTIDDEAAIENLFAHNTNLGSLLVQSVPGQGWFETRRSTLQRLLRQAKLQQPKMWMNVATIKEASGQQDAIHARYAARTYLVAPLPASDHLLKLPHAIVLYQAILSYAHIDRAPITRCTWHTARRMLLGIDDVFTTFLLPEDFKDAMLHLVINTSVGRSTDSSQWIINTTRQQADQIYAPFGCASLFAISQRHPKPVLLQSRHGSGTSLPAPSARVFRKALVYNTLNSDETGIDCKTINTLAYSQTPVYAIQMNKKTGHTQRFVFN